MSLRKLSCALLTLAAVSWIGAQDDASPSEMRARALRWGAVADSLTEIGQLERALGILDEGIQTCEAGGDTLSANALRMVRARNMQNAGNAREAYEEMLRVAALAEARRDSMLLSDALYYQGRALDAMGRDPRATAAYERQIQIAEAMDDSFAIARAETYLARRYRHEGDLDRAAEHLERSSTIFTAIGEHERRDVNRVLEGLIAAMRGRRDEALIHWRAGAAASREWDNSSTYVNCLTNIAVLEHREGDPGVAMACWREAREISLRHGRAREAIRPTQNLALSLIDLGRFEEGEALLQEALALCLDREFLDLEGETRMQLARLASDRRDFQLAAARYREALPILFARGDHMDRFMGTRGLAYALVQADSLEAGVAAAHSLERFRAHLPPQTVLELDMSIANVDLRAGRAQEALERLDRVQAQIGWENLTTDELNLLIVRAQALAELDRPAEALAAYERARSGYEELREVPGDPQWREQRSGFGQRIYVALAELRRSHERADCAELHALLQPYKARTLLERVRGTQLEDAPHESDAIELARLQGELLRDGELLLDLYSDDDRALLFAISRGHCSVTPLPGGDELHARLGNLAELLAAADPSLRAATREAARRLHEQLIAPALAGHGQTTRILWSPDGELARVPLALLLESSGNDCDVQRIPSTQLFALLRTRHEAGEREGILAMLPAGDPTLLPGAHAEVERLRREFAPVAVRSLEQGFEASLGQSAVLHIAAHARTVDNDPWRSSILFDATEASGLRGSPGERPRQIVAQEIAQMKLGLDLVVLSACETMGGERFPGAGVLGLSSAFLSAGARQVLATLWPVDDHATHEFVRHFYERMAQGQRPAAALRLAQAQLRARENTADPFYWAGFVLVGDDGAGPPPALRRVGGLANGPLTWALLALFALVFAWLGWRRR